MNVRTFGEARIALTANGSPQFVERLEVTATSGHQTTAFSGGEMVLLVNDGSSKCYFHAQTSDAGEVTTENGWPLNPDEKLLVTLKRDETHIAFITASGTTDVIIGEME